MRLRDLASSISQPSLQKHIYGKPVDIFPSLVTTLAGRNTVARLRKMRPTSGSCANVLPTLDNLTPTLRLLCGCVRFRGRFVVGVKASLLGKSRSHLGISQTRSLPGRTDLTTSIKIDVVSSCLSPSASGSASRDRQDDRSSFHLDPWGEPSPRIHLVHRMVAVLPSASSAGSGFAILVGMPPLRVDSACP